MTRSPPPRFCSTWGLKPTHVWQWYWPITSTIIMRSTTGSPRNPKATGVWKWCDALRKAKASCCCPNVGWSNAPSPGWVGVVATAKTMSVVQIQANRCCGSVLCTSCSSDLNPPRFIPHSAIEWRHRRLFGETLSCETQDQLHNEAKRLATVFQRSSSNVEGRNGYLSLRSHQLRGLDRPRKRECFTT